MPPMKVTHRAMKTRSACPIMCRALYGLIPNNQAYPTWYAACALNKEAREDQESVETVAMVVVAVIGRALYERQS